VIFADANLDGSHFDSVRTENTSFTNANLAGTTWTGATLAGANFTGAILARADFGDTSLDFSEQQLYSTASYKQHNLRGIRIGTAVIG